LLLSAPLIAGGAGITYQEGPRTPSLKPLKTISRFQALKPHRKGWV
jgi:hypothetical protein